MSTWSTEQRGSVLIASFSNPPYNYIGTAVIDELNALITEWEDPSIRVVILQGPFNQYSVEELNAVASDPAQSRYAGVAGRGFKTVFDRLVALRKITIAAMTGDAMGGAFELTLACDLRIGQHGDFRYGNPEVRVGVIPGAGATQRISRLVGLAKALDWICRGRIVNPETALELGLVHEVADDASARAFELAEEIACLPPLAVANAKRAIYQGADATLQAGFEIENMNWTEALQSDDVRVAVKAFIDVAPTRRRDWFESSSSSTYPAYEGH